MEPRRGDRWRVIEVEGWVVSWFGFARLCALASLREIAFLAQEFSREGAEAQRKTAKQDPKQDITQVRAGYFLSRLPRWYPVAAMIELRSYIFRVFMAGLIAAGAMSVSFAQDTTKRNDRPPEQPSPTPQHTEEKKQPVDATRYTYEFNQPAFIVSHIVIEHDALGRGNITFVQRTETPIVEPIEISSAAGGRIFGLWTELRFLDSNENYQAAKNFAHLGTYKIGMNDGKRKRIAEFNWSDNKTAWALAAEYRNVANQAIWVFDMKLAREMQPLNTPSLLTEVEGYLTRNELSDPHQLVPLLNELKTDYHIPLIARNHADRILKKIEK